MAKPIEVRSLFEDRAREQILGRIIRLQPDATPRWGEMTVGQMLAHCAEAQEVLNGRPLEGTPWFLRLAGPLIRRAVLARRPFPRGVPTHPQYLKTEDEEFTTQRERLVAAVEAFARTEGDDYRHAMFGTMTPAERGWASYKHLDHHLTQFGV